MWKAECGKIEAGKLAGYEAGRRRPEQKSGFRNDQVMGKEHSVRGFQMAGVRNILTSILTDFLTPDTRHLKPILYTLNPEPLI